MKNTLFLTMLAVAFLGSGVAKAAGTLYASQYGVDYTREFFIELGTSKDYDKLVVDTPLTLTGENGYLDLYNGATFEFLADDSGAICSIFTPAERPQWPVYFNNNRDVYNFMFDADTQAIVAASAGTPITLIEALNKDGEGFLIMGSPTLQLNGKMAGQTVEMGGVQFTYVGPKEDGYTFKEGEIGFKGYYAGSHNLSLVAKGTPTPEPTTGSLSLLALAGLCARRRKK